MKKFLFIIGATGIIGGLWYYFKKQLDLALNYDYDVSDFKILELNTTKAVVSTDIKLSNKSAFEIEVLNYDLTILYKKHQIIRTISENPFLIKADSIVKINATGEISFTEAKEILLPFALNVVQQKPINVNLYGFVKVRFLGIEHTIDFANEQIEYSSNLLAEYGLDDDLEKIKNSIPFLKK